MSRRSARLALHPRRRRRRAAARRSGRRATSARTRSSSRSSTGGCSRPSTSTSTTIPKRREVARIAARMAERSYARLSRLMNYQFKERKPIIVFALARRLRAEQRHRRPRRGHGRRHRRAAPAQHVLLHRRPRRSRARADARNGAPVPVRHLRPRPRRQRARDTCSSASPPLWFAEGMAEYLSIGPNHPATDGIIRDAALNGNAPDDRADDADQPDRVLPLPLRRVVLARTSAQRWGDEIIGEIMQTTPSVGVERAFKRQTRHELEELGDEWREAMQTQYLPPIGGSTGRARSPAAAHREAHDGRHHPRLRRAGAVARRQARSRTSRRAACCAPRSSSTSTWPTRQPASGSSG